MYFYGVGSNLGARILRFLQQATYNVDGLLGVFNLKLFDSNGDEVIGSSGDGDIGDTGTTGNPSLEIGGNGDQDESTSTGGDPSTDTLPGTVVNGNLGNGGVNSLNNEAEVEEGVSKWSKTLIGVGVATTVMGLILCCYFCNRRQTTDESEGEGKVDFEHHSLPLGQPGDARAGTGEASTDGAVLDDRLSRTWPTNDDHSSNSEEEIDEDDEIQVSYSGDTHVCNSSFCEVCAHRQPQVQFISSGYQEQDELPEDATRNYHVSDTIAL